MAKTKTSFGKDSQPTNRRGKSQKTLILDALKEVAALELPEDATKEQVEQRFIQKTAERALNPADKSSAMLLSILWNKGWKNIKPSSECVEFDFDQSATPAEQSAQILKAASEGVISPDIANVFIQAVAATLKIEEVTELQKRLEDIEQKLGVING